MELRGYEAQITDEARGLRDRGFDPGSGCSSAASRDSAINALSERILFGDILPGRVVTVGVGGRSAEREFLTLQRSGKTDSGVGFLLGDPLEFAVTLMRPGGVCENSSRSPRPVCA